MCCSKLCSPFPFCSEKMTHLLQCVAVCCSVLPCVAVHCSVFCVEVCFIVWQLKFQSFVLPSNNARHEHELYILTTEDWDSEPRCVCGPNFIYELYVLTKQPCIRSRKNPTCALKRALYLFLKETSMCSQKSQSFNRSSKMAHHEKSSVFSQNRPTFALERALYSLSK